MKEIIKIVLMSILLFSFTVSVNAKDFSKMGQNPQLLQEGKEKPWCHICGMSLKMFYKTSHAVVLKDGKKRQYCSIRCLVVDWGNIKDRVKEILVIDAKTQKMISAKKAYYVVGSKVKGTMSRVSKIAFEKEEDAKEFQSKYKGKIVNFDKAFEIAKEGLKKDIAMLQKKKQRMVYPKGKAIYKKLCKEDIDKTRFNTIGELKTYIAKSGVCGNIKGKKLQMLSLYIWEVKGNKTNEIKSHIKVPEDAKCPVCGMYVHKYPRWATKVTLNGGKELYFDGVKDMFKFLLNTEEYGHKKSEVKQITVTDYYHQVAISAKKGYYVFGSNILGPMGNELIPFKSKKDAEQFLIDHRGKKVLSFDEIDKGVINSLE